MNYTVKRETFNILFIVLGSLLLAMGIVLFLAPNRIATGGTPGCAILLHYVLGLPLGVLMIAINIILLAFGWKYMGNGFVVRTIAAIILISVLVDFLAEILKVPALVDNPMLATLYGGIAVGFGVGFILKGDASAGGSTIVAKIVASKRNIRPGQVILTIDVFIIISSAFVFNDIERSLWSLISIYVTAKCIDMLLTGTPTEKVVHIVSDHVDVLSRLITEKIGPNGTIVTGSGLVKNQKKKMIFVVVDVQRIRILKEIIRNNDPDAFMVVMTASEMLGRGH